jgi:maltose alpha-D-glucosyltransferase / alpha-amylase
MNAGPHAADAVHPSTRSSTALLPVPSDRQRTHSADRGWHQVAVFYEVIVRSFADSNGDGIGDLAGLTNRRDYLEWLGVDCLWLPPFYLSPLRDGGYDVADYTDSTQRSARSRSSKRSWVRRTPAA